MNQISMDFGDFPSHKKPIQRSSQAREWKRSLSDGGDEGLMSSERNPEILGIRIDDFREILLLISITLWL